MLSLALYQPDIPQNTGAAIRLCACLGVRLEVIEPCGFRWDARKIRQSAMDYYDALTLKRHVNWTEFSAHAKQDERRRILMTTKADMPYWDFAFQPNDILIAGRESAGVPDDVHNECEVRVGIPMMAGMRSLNVINASAMILGEALRQNVSQMTFGGAREY